MATLPAGSAGLGSWRAALQIFASVLAIAGAARLDIPIPGSPVPQSAQTLAVLLLGLVLGARVGTLALVAYLFAGALGAPVFADGARGWGHLVGPTSGYLLGFAVAAGMVGWLAERGTLRQFAPAFVAMLGAHAIILILGWARLGATVGFEPAYSQGVAPFLVGGIAKSLVAALAAVFWTRGRRPGPEDPSRSTGRASDPPSSPPRPEPGMPPTR